MRKSFDEQLDIMDEELRNMGALCESAIATAAKALTEGSGEMAQEVFKLEEDINKKERDIESICLKLLLQQQPVASDLRQISSAMKMITDLERIGDQATDIAEIVKTAKLKANGNTPFIGEMARATIKMVSESINAFVNSDPDLAREVIRSDDTVDDLFLSAKIELSKYFGENPEKGSYALDLLMVAKYLERIGDHSTNIADWVLYSITGEHEK